MFAEVFPEDGVKRCEVARIVQPDAATDNMLRSVAGFLKNGEQILDCLAGLSDDASGNEFAVHHGNLAGDIEPSIRLPVLPFAP